MNSSARPDCHRGREMTDATVGARRRTPRRLKGAFDDDVYGKSLDVGQLRACCTG